MCSPPLIGTLKPLRTLALPCLGDPAAPPLPSSVQEAGRASIVRRARARSAQPAFHVERLRPLDLHLVGSDRPSILGRGGNGNRGFAQRRSRYGIPATCRDRRAARGPVADRLDEHPNTTHRAITRQHDRVAVTLPYTSGRALVVEQHMSSPVCCSTCDNTYVAGPAASTLASAAGNPAEFASDSTTALHPPTRTHVAPVIATALIRRFMITRSGQKGEEQRAGRMLASAVRSPQRTHGTSTACPTNATTSRSSSNPAAPS